MESKSCQKSKTLSSGFGAQPQNPGAGGSFRKQMDIHSRTLRSTDSGMQNDRL